MLFTHLKEVARNNKKKKKTDIIFLTLHTGEDSKPPILPSTKREVLDFRHLTNANAKHSIFLHY